ncbi:MAG: T9SS type A sorting domain-containing protein [Chloroflexota bacterium]
MKEGERVEIYDLLGQIVLSANPEERIDISGFTNGLYYVRVGDFIEKIIKVK